MSVEAVETPTIVTVAEGFHVRQAVDNMGWIDLGGFAVVVDALEQAHLESEVFDAIADTLGRVPIRYVLNTHAHYDHTALNDAFRRRCGAQVVGLATGGVPDGGRWFEGDRRRVQMLPTPGCHTPEDCCIWAPAEKALFVGDLFGWGLIPLTGSLDDAGFGRLMETYDLLIGFGAETVIPGHGPLASNDELKRQQRYYRRLVERVAAGRAEGRTDAEIADEVACPDDMADWWRFRQWKHADSVSKVIAAVRAGRLSADDGQ